MRRLAIVAGVACALACGEASADGLRTGQVFGQGVFLNAAGAQVTPRGANYVVLDSTGWHATFDPSTYSPAAAESALSGMQLQKYDTVRVTLDCAYEQSSFGPPSSGAWQPYAKVLADFITRARNHGIQVLLAVQGIPFSYQAGLAATPMVTGNNLQVLDDAYVSARGQFLADLLWELEAVSPLGRQLLSSIAAIDACNECTVNSASGPFNLTSGKFSWHNVSWDLSSQAARQQLIDQASVWLMAVVSADIKTVDPNILVSMSQYPPGQIGLAGYNGAWPKAGVTGNAANQPFRIQPILASVADYVDVHDYEWTLTDDLPSDFATFGIAPSTLMAKPMLMSEYGMVTSTTPSAKVAGSALATHMRNSCAYGVSGWTIWTWNTTGETPSLWTLVGGLNTSLDRVALPTVCSDIPESDFLAYGGIYHSNGGSFCWYDTWAHFEQIARTSSIAGLKTYARVPPDMPYVGTCTAQNDVR
jgi:hypothetical protein